ncbi:HIT family protein [Rhizobium sp. 11_C7_N12_5]|uniref:HIT family protein n=1 Tax=Rhizobium sp. 11_C7_N12_5 TaxID=3240770 RepID=UPI003F2925BF
MRLHNDCIFCRISGKQSPAYVVHESPNFICFFPIKPDVYGHTLIASKAHYRDLRDCPPELGQDFFGSVQFMFMLYGERLGATGFNLLNANGKSAEQSIDHLHFHFLPRFAEDGLNAWPVLPPIETDLSKLFKILEGS